MFDDYRYMYKVNTLGTKSPGSSSSPSKDIMSVR